jgi:lysosomal Pro-X carboxypeptidase
MLSYWFRLKYPGIVTGALAASAPVLQYEGITPPEVFNRIATADFTKAGGAECSDAIRTGIAAINNASMTDAGRAELTRDFQLCEPMTAGQGATLLSIIYNGLT